MWVKNICKGFTLGIFATIIKKKGVIHMPTEKKLNVNLLDKLDLLERLEMADNEGGYEKIKQQLAFERKCIERKLYQQPPLTSDNH
ncbi:MAG: hypothetical protein NC307_08230 [Roseburia sp.]|nr:hypothetical protein [Roseburia sp.]